MKTYLTIFGTIVTYTAALYAVGKYDENKRKMNGLKKRNEFLERKLKACYHTLDYAFDQLHPLDREAAHKMNKTFKDEYEFQKTIRDF